MIWASFYFPGATEPLWFFTWPAASIPLTLRKNARVGARPVTATIETAIIAYTDLDAKPLVLDLHDESKWDIQIVVKLPACLHPGRRQTGRGCCFPWSGIERRDRAQWAISGFGFG